MDRRDSARTLFAARPATALQVVAIRQGILSPLCAAADEADASADSASSIGTPFLRATRNPPLLPVRLAGVLVGLVFVAAALLKGADKIASAGPVNEAPRAWQDRLEPALIILELALGIWLISAIHWRTSQSLAVISLAALSGVSLASLVAGDPSCGCFGRVESSPAVTLALDVGAALALMLPPRVVRIGRHGGERALRRFSR